MKTVCWLDDIADAMEQQSESLDHYLDRETGQIILLGEEELSAAEEGEDLSDYPAWERQQIETAQRVLRDKGERFLALPDQFEIHEYRMLEDFSTTYPDGAVSSELVTAIRGRGAFRYFKDTIHRLGIQEEWYEYQRRRYMELAKEWCEAHGLRYETRRKSP